MKKLSLFAAILFILSITMSCDKEKTLSPEDTPAEITQFVKDYFPDESIIQTIKEVDGVRTTYEVILTNNFKLEFNRKKEIIEMKGDKALPDKAISSSILSFVNSNYSNNYILAWELEKKYQEIKLDNKLELQFSLSGDFIKIDD